MAGTRSARAGAAEPPVRDARFLVVEGRYYEDLADELLAGARGVLEAAGARVEVVTVPGALEIPIAAEIAVDAAEQAGDPYAGVVALGCVIRGETYHFEVVAGESSRALMDLAVKRGLPAGNGILTVESMAQAWERARVGEGDKGGGAAEAALCLLRLKRRVNP